MPKNQWPNFKFDQPTSPLAWEGPPNEITSVITASTDSCPQCGSLRIKFLYKKSNKYELECTGGCNWRTIGYDY